MVIGLDRFKKHFAPYANQYVLIGGTACSIIMEESGLDFRSTKDLDIVLYVEALDANFVEAFWKFVQEGGYQNRQKSTGKEIFYRFSSPSQFGYPSMMELFSRIPDTVTFSGGGHLTPIPIHESVVSLSAILLDENYYNFIQSGKQLIDNLSVLDALHLIPLKARAFLDLMEQKRNGADIDEKDIRKHKNDVIRLYQLLTPHSQIELSSSLKNDMSTFLKAINADQSIDCKNLGLKNTTPQKIIETLSLIYGVFSHVPDINMVTDN
jgi:hypothetical protein